MPDSAKKAIVLVDLDYIWIEFNERGEKFDPFELMNLIRSAGYSIALAQSYCDYQESRYGENFQRDQTTAGFRQVQCPIVRTGGGNRKSTADPEIINDVSWAVQNLDFDSLVLVAGDRDFIRAAQSAKNIGKEFCLVRVGVGVSGDLTRTADCFIDVPVGLESEVEAAFDAASEETVLELQPAASGEELLRLRERFGGHDYRSPSELQSVVAAETAAPIPLAEIGRVFTLEVDEIDAFLDGCTEDVRGYLVTVFPRVDAVISDENRVGRPAALRHILNVLGGDLYSDPVAVGNLMLGRDDLFRLLKLAASYGVLRSNAMFPGTTSYRLDSSHPFAKWMARQPTPGAGRR